MSLRAGPIEQTATLAGGRTILVRVGLPDDSYIPSRELTTVDVELYEDGIALAAVNTILRPEQASEARALAREIAEGLEAGQLEPTAASIEPLADRLPDVTT